MKILLVLPPTDEAGPMLLRQIAWAERRFGAAPVLAATEDMRDHYGQTFARPVLAYDPESTPSGADIVILVRGAGERDCAVPPPPDFAGRVYVQERDGRLALHNKPFDEMEIAGVDAHAFSRLAPRRTAGYYYFPYGCLAHYPGMGPVDSFGFRGTGDWQALRDRPSSHKLIIVSGGSAVWSQCCLADEAFPAVLERLLNGWCRDSGLTVQFTVLNFGMFGNLVLHQSLNYQLFGERLRPDCVIAHDGFNDLVFGLMSDPWLLAEHSVAYQPEFEVWAQLLQQSPSALMTQRSEPYQAINLPHVAVRAYVERKLQFRRFVEAGGVRFVWGFQPCIFSKGELSLDERRSVETPDPIYGDIHRRLPFVYESFDSLSRRPSDLAVVDCHQAFKAFGSGERLFHDHVHTTPLGDQKIARLYFETLRQDMSSGVFTTAPAARDPGRS